MFGDLQGPQKIPVPEEEFMPFNCKELNKSLLDYARTHLNETEETKERALEEMKELVKKEGNLPLEVPDLFYLCFLRSRKFDVKRACDLLRKGADFVHSHRSLFDRVDSDAVRRSVQSKVVGFLPYRDAKHRAILYIRSECWNPSELKASDLIFGSIVSLHVAAENPVNQVAGFVVILDLNHLTLEQILAISNWLLFGIQAMQRCCPCLVKEFHIVHTPVLFRATWKVIKPVISEKIKKRILFYKSSHWDSLHRRIHPRLLPEELGGQLGPYTYDHWAGNIADIEKRYNRKISLFLNNYREE